MNIKEVSSKKLFKEYALEIPFQEVDSSVNKKITELIPTVSLPGFRKGKAPLNIVRKKYENNVISEVIEKIIQKNIKKLLDEKKLQPFRQPKVEIKKYQKDLPIEISVKIDIKPDIKISSFEEIELIDRSIELDKKNKDENYKNFINSRKHYHKLNELRAVKLTDKITANISTDDKAVPDFLKSQKNIPIITDSDYQILPEISDKLIKNKVKTGDKIKLKFDLAKALKLKKKKEVEFLIEIVSIEYSHDFKVTKEFLEKNNFKSEKDLQNNINQNLQKQYDDYLKQIQKKELMDILDKKNKFDVPEGILDEELSSIWQRIQMAKKEDKLDEDDKNLSDIELKKRYEKIALRRVKLAILMQHIGDMEKILVSEKELADGLLNYASQYPGQEKEIFEYFKKNPSSAEAIRGPIFEQKIIDHILSKVKLKKEQINVNKFEKLQESTFKTKDV